VPVRCTSHPHPRQRGVASAYVVFDTGPICARAQDTVAQGGGALHRATSHASVPRVVVTQRTVIRTRFVPDDEIVLLPLPPNLEARLVEVALQRRKERAGL